MGNYADHQKFTVQCMEGLEFDTNIDTVTCCKGQDKKGNHCDKEMVFCPHAVQAANIVLSKKIICCECKHNLRTKNHSWSLYICPDGINKYHADPSVLCINCIKTKERIDDYEIAIKRK